MPRLYPPRRDPLPLYEYSRATAGIWATSASAPGESMDFAAWMEVYLGGRWYTFDPRNNVPRIGRVLMARGRVTPMSPLPRPSDRTRWSASRSWRKKSASRWRRAISRLSIGRSYAIHCPSPHGVSVRGAEQIGASAPRKSRPPTARRAVGDHRPFHAAALVHDVFDSIAIATFDVDGQPCVLTAGPGARHHHCRTIRSRRLHTYPFRYAADEVPNLARALAHHYPSEEVARWVRQFLPRPEPSTPCACCGPSHWPSRTSLSIHTP